LRVLGIRRSGDSHPNVDEMFGPDDLDNALPRADLVVLAAPLTEATAQLLDRRRIQLMKLGSGFINIGRAGSVDNKALIEALNTGKLSGAILDVFEQEPLSSTSPLWQTENLILMQHVTSDDEDKYLPKTLDLAFDNVRRLIEGHDLLNVVNPQSGY